MFNQTLREWLNARDHTSADWPDNVSKEVRMSADREVGHGHMLDSQGWPMPEKGEA